jgi:AraC family transcriptional regulator
MTDSSQPVHPSDIIPESWVMQTMTIGSGGLTVAYHIEEPSEIAVPALTHHLLGINIGQQGTRQITRLGRQEYDGIGPTGFLWLATADDTSCEWAWETTDEAISFQIDPLYFQEIAAENGCANSERLELKPVVFDRNPQFESIARNYHAEMQQQGLGGKLYSESLGNLFMLNLLRIYGHIALSVCSKSADRESQAATAAKGFSNYRYCPSLWICRSKPFDQAFSQTCRDDSQSISGRLTFKLK